ncbi:MAG: dihydroneopterin aldolase [Bacteroidales bacterium]
MAEIAIEGMSFRAYHGCMDEEKALGNQYTVDLVLEADTSRAEETDHLADTVDYAKVYELVAEEMEIPSKLLENVARRILNRLEKEFDQVVYAEVKVSKHNPPIKGQAKAVSVLLTTEDVRQKD